MIVLYPTFNYIVYLFPLLIRLKLFMQYNAHSICEIYQQVLYVWLCARAFVIYV